MTRTVCMMRSSSAAYGRQLSRPAGSGGTPPRAPRRALGLQLATAREQPLGPEVRGHRQRGGDAEAQPDVGVALAEEAVAHRVHEVEDRVHVRELLPRGVERVDRV